MLFLILIEPLSKILLFNTNHMIGLVIDGLSNFYEIRTSIHIMSEYLNTRFMLPSYDIIRVKRFLNCQYLGGTAVKSLLISDLWIVGVAE